MFLLLVAFHCIPLRCFEFIIFTLISPPFAISRVCSVPACVATAATTSTNSTVAADCDGADDVHVHGSGHDDGRDSIVICEGGDVKDDLFVDLGERSVLDITADDDDVLV